MIIVERARTSPLDLGGRGSETWRRVELYEFSISQAWQQTEERWIAVYH